jgi:hypothetical protein
VKKPREKTVGELRAAIADLPDDAFVSISPADSEDIDISVTGFEQVGDEGFRINACLYHPYLELYEELGGEPETTAAKLEIALTACEELSARYKRNVEWEEAPA